MSCDSNGAGGIQTGHSKDSLSLLHNFCSLYRRLQGWGLDMSNGAFTHMSVVGCWPECSCGLSQRLPLTWGESQVEVIVTFMTQPQRSHSMPSVTCDYLRHLQRSAWVQREKADPTLEWSMSASHHKNSVRDETVWENTIYLTAQSMSWALTIPTKNFFPAEWEARKKVIWDKNV